MLLPLWSILLGGCEIWLVAVCGSCKGASTLTGVAIELIGGGFIFIQLVCAWTVKMGALETGFHLFAGETRSSDRQIIRAACSLQQRGAEQSLHFLQ